jgi:hypothetical protein
MGEIKKPVPEKLISGFIYKEAMDYEKAKKAMTLKFGPADLESAEMEFNYTDYYGAEMGRGLKRRFLSFEKLIDPAALSTVKVFTDRIEKKNMRSGTHNRKVNIDPGLISLPKLVLATTKNFAHRIYIGNGIYAEVTLRYMAGHYTKLEWTYPDYASPEYTAVLNEIREIYRKQLAGREKGKQAEEKAKKS